MLSSTEGISVSWFVSWEVFLVLNLWLAYRAHQAQASLVTTHTLIMYGFYAVMIGLDLSVVTFRESWSWTGTDTVTAVAVAAGVIATFVVRNGGLADPILKGWLAVFFKAVPQLVLAWGIFTLGGSGLALAAIVAGHVTILCRIGQLLFAIREAGWDKNRLGSFISEVPNELSWIVVTVAWLW